MVLSENKLGFIEAGEWFRRLGEGTGLFEVKEVVFEGSGRGDRDWDISVTLELPHENRGLKFLVEVKKQLTPQIMLGLIERFRAWTGGELFVVCAPVISPRVMEMCREANIGYLDSAGNCRLRAQGLLIERSGRRSEQRGKRGTADPFSRLSSRIVRVLLSEPGRGRQVQELAREAEVSIGLVSKVKGRLLEEAYVEERGRLLYLRDGVKLLRDWSVRYRPKVRVLSVYSLLNSNEIEGRISEWCKRAGFVYGLTQLSAAWRYLPTVRYDRIVSYIDSRLETERHLDSLLKHLEGRLVDSGANCVLWLTSDQSVFAEHQLRSGIAVVSPLQVYLDLKLLSGRGGEAAEEIAEKYLNAHLKIRDENRDRPGDGS